MKGKLIISGVVATALTAAGVTAASASASPNITRARQISVHGRLDTLTQLDLGKKGLNPGDEFVAVQTLYQNGKRVGHDSIVNTYTDTRGASQCVFTLALPDGEITGQVLISAGQTVFDAAVTGGTRRYENVRGHVHVRDMSNGDANFVLQLIR